ncbi:G kinase-anchoring protein 1-B [Lamellibrachia satsuma]|nr:G kinase-anchoring protein 1-B [Lamellibrachia satsuma]
MILTAMKNQIKVKHQVKKDTQQSTTARKRNKKKKKNLEKLENDELRSLAFGKPGKHKVSTQAHTQDTPTVPVKQWEEWKKTDTEYTEDVYEKDLAHALLLSKLEVEEKKVVLLAVKDDNGGQEADSKKKKKKNKERAVMSLKEFRQLENGTVAADELDTIEHPSSPVSTPAAEADPLFFDKVQQDVENIVRKEIIQDEYRKHYHVENAQVLHFQEEIAKKDTEIVTLKEATTKLEGELKQVKKRNQQLCHILAQGEMKDKTAILLELDDLKQVRDELTEEVRTLTTDLEKERSKSKSLRSDQDRQSEKMEKSEKQDKHDKHDRGKAGRHAGK